MSDHRARLYDRAAQLIAPRELPDIVEWLPANVNICDKESDYKGPYTWDNCPDLKEIAQSCVSPYVETIVIVGPTQSFKSTLLTGVAAYTIGVDHGPIGWVFGSADIARAFSQKRIQPTIEGSPVLREQKPDNPDEYKTLELGMKTCTVRLAGSNSPGNLATFSYKRVIGDEVDKYPALLGTESGTLDLLLLRTDQYTHHNHIFASSPTVPDGTIWRAALRGDCRRYHVPCPKCHKPFVQDFSCLRWDQGARSRRGVWDFERVAATAHLECPHCHGEIWENDRHDMLHAGQWLPDPVTIADQRRGTYDLVADPKRRSYFRSCFNVLHPNRTFAAIAVKHLMAGNDPSARQNFTNGQLGEVYEPHAEKLDWEVLWERRESYMDGDNPDNPEPFDVTLPEGVLLLAAGVDAQENPPRLECEIVGYGVGDESWGVQYKVIDGDPLKWETWMRLHEFLAYAWKHPAGHYLRPAVVSIDTGYGTEMAYKYVQFCQPRRVLAVKGSKGGYGEPLIDRPKKSGVKRVALWMVGTVTAKLTVYSRLQVAESGPGCCHFPMNPARGYDEQYFRGVTAERIVWKMEAGRKVPKFVPGPFKRNEPLDIRCYILGGIDVLRPNYKAIAARHSTHEDEQNQDTDGVADDSRQRKDIPREGAKVEVCGVGNKDGRDGRGNFGSAGSGEGPVFDPATGKIEAEKSDAEKTEPTRLHDAEPVGKGAQPLRPEDQPPPAPTQAPRPKPNITLPHKFRRPRMPGRGGFVQSWRH